jgi:hypothetical protein
MRLTVALLVLVGVGCSSSSHPGTDGGSDLTVNAPIPGSGTTNSTCSWAQFGQNAAHTGTACTPAQGFTSVLATLTVDPFVDQEVIDGKAQNGEADLFAHYQTALVTGDDVYVETKGGSYTRCTNVITDSNGNIISTTSADGGPCGSQAWNSQVWSEAYYHWQAGALVQVASFESDWKPEPGDLASWEPVFHAALDGNVLWVPGAGGTVYRVDRLSMQKLSQLNPFGSTVDPNAYVSGPLTVAPDGTVLYNVLRVQPDLSDASGVLVRIEPDGVTVHAVDYAALMVNPPSPTGSCLGTYVDDGTPLPWPPPDHHRVSVTCGSLRPGINLAPAVGADGTVFTAAFPHQAPNASVMLAVHADLTPKWSTSLQEILNDGCGVTVPADAEMNALEIGYSHCSFGAPLGVDPLTGQMPSALVSDQSTSSPVVLPDGSVLYGALNYYNSARGHLLKFDATGRFVASYDDGWDQTPAVWVNGGTYSAIVKDNHYFSYISAQTGPYFITQVDGNMVKQWSFGSTNNESCVRGAGGTLSCVPDHPTGFEWCVNAAAVDAYGTVYANSEDGRVYAILQGATLAQSRFLQQSLGAAYTPVTVDGQGRTYTQNGGVLTVLGK